MGKDVLNSRLSKFKLDHKLSDLKKKAGFIIQSLIFPRKRYSNEQAKKWAKDHGYTSKKMNVTDNFIRLRQKEPNIFKTFKTIVLGNGIKAIIGAGNVSRFVGHLYLKENFSKFGKIIDGKDIKMPLKVQMKFLCEGENRDGIISRSDLELSLPLWSALPIIDWHDFKDRDHPTKHAIKDRKGYLGNSPKLELIDGKTWIISDAYITNSDLAYLIYVSNKVKKPLEISPEFAWKPYFVGEKLFQGNITPHLISIVDEGEISGNQITITS